MTYRDSDHSGGRRAFVVGMLVDEEIESVATPALRRDILASALREAGLSAMPFETHELSVFTRTALRKALAAALGDTAANEVCRRLRSALAQTSSSGTRTLPPGVATPDTCEKVTAAIPRDSSPRFAARSA